MRTRKQFHNHLNCHPYKHTHALKQARVHAPKQAHACLPSRKITITGTVVSEHTINTHTRMPSHKLTHTRAHKHMVMGTHACHNAYKDRTNARTEARTHSSTQNCTHARTHAHNHAYTHAPAFNSARKEKNEIK